MTPIEVDEVVKNLRDNRSLKWRFDSSPSSWERADTMHRGYRYTVWGGDGGLLIEHMPTGNVGWSFSVGKSNLGQAFAELYARLNEEAPKPPDVQSRLDDAADSLR